MNINMMTKEEEIIDKQVEIFTQAVSKAVIDATKQCVDKDGTVATQAISVALAKTFGSSLAALTYGMPQKEKDRIIDLLLNLAKEAAKQCSKDIEDTTIKN